MLQLYSGGRGPSNSRRIELSIPEFLLVIGSLVLFVILTGWAFHFTAELPPGMLIEWVGKTTVELLPW